MAVRTRQRRLRQQTWVNWNICDIGHRGPPRLFTTRRPTQSKNTDDVYAFGFTRLSLIVSSACLTIPLTTSTTFVQQRNADAPKLNLVVFTCPSMFCARIKFANDARHLEDYKVNIAGCGPFERSHHLATEVKEVASLLHESCFGYLRCVCRKRRQ